MRLSEMTNQPRANKINRVVESRFGFKIDYDNMTFKKAYNVVQGLNETLTQVRRTHGARHAEQNPQYMEMFMVREALNRWMVQNQQQLIVKLSKKYGFDSKEALEYIKRGTPLLPFDGKNRKECCQALSKQCGLFLQCTGIPDENDKEYCKKCEKSNAATTNGTIETRLVLGEKDFKEKKGDILKSYEQYIKQKKWTVEEIIQEAQQQGRTLEVQDSWISASLPQKRGRHPKPQEEKEVKEQK